MRVLLTGGYTAGRSGRGHCLTAESWLADAIGGVLWNDDPGRSYVAYRHHRIWNDRRVSARTTNVLAAFDRAIEASREAAS